MGLFLLRCLTVWSASTATCVGLGVWAAAGASAGGSFEALLSRVSVLALIACCAWAWWTITVVVATAVRDGLHGRPHHACAAPVGSVPPWARRLVLAACGVALVGTAQVGPAHAAPGVIAVAAAQAGHDPGPGALAGLPLPDRTTGPLRVVGELVAVGRVTAEAISGTSVTVRSGDSLWLIAERLLAPEASPSAVAGLAARLYDLNRAGIGGDPDLILPGQQLRTPLSVRPAR